MASGDDAVSNSRFANCTSLTNSVCDGSTPTHTNKYIKPTTDNGMELPACENMHERDRSVLFTEKHVALKPGRSLYTGKHWHNNTSRGVNHLSSADEPAG